MDIGLSNQYNELNEARNEKMKLLAIGDNEALIYPGDGMMYPAGSALTVAAYAARLGFDADYMGVFGSDAYARLTKDALVAMGIGIGQCRFSSLPSTRRTAAPGDRLPPPDNDYELALEMPLALNARDFAYVAGFDGVFTCAAAHIDHRLTELMNAGPIIGYDFATLWRWDSLKAVCPNVHVAFFDLQSLSDYEGQRFLSSVCSLGCYLALGVTGDRRVVVATRRSCVTLPANRIETVADANGEREAFIAAFFTAFCSMSAFRKKALASAPDFLLEPADEYRFEDTGFAACVTAGQYMAARACMLPGAFGRGLPLP